MSRRAWMRWLPLTVAGVLILVGGLLLWLPAPQPTATPPVSQARAPSPTPPRPPLAVPPAPGYSEAIRPDPTAPPGPAPQPQVSLRGTVCLDVGRPGELPTPAAEATLLRPVARDLAAILTRRGLRVVWARDSIEQAVPLGQRMAAAERSQAALLVRLFCETGAGGGWAVYWPDRSVSLGERSGPSKAVIGASSVAAEVIAAHLERSTADRLPGRGLRIDLQALEAERVGLAAGAALVNVPVVSVAIGDLAEPLDVSWLSDSQGRWIIVDGLAQGIERFVTAAADVAAESAGPR